jgi:hypothetical protein
MELMFQQKEMDQGVYLYEENVVQEMKRMVEVQRASA